MEIYQTSEIHHNLTNVVMNMFQNLSVGKEIIQKQIVIARIREPQIYYNSLQKLMMTILIMIYSTIESTNKLRT